jgi:hypothetical protein
MVLILLFMPSRGSKDQKPLVSDHLRILDRFPQKRRRVPLLGMLLPIAKLSSDQVSLSAQIRKDLDITVNTPVRPGQPFLFRLGIIEGTDVNIQRRQLALRVDTVPTSRAVLQIKRADSSLTIPSKAPLTIQPLPEGRAGRTLLDLRTISEKGNVPKRLNCLLFRLSYSQQSDHRFHNIAMGNLGFPSSRQRHSVYTRPQVHQGADQGQPRMASQMFVALFND